MSFSAWTMFVLFFLWSFLGMPIGHAMLASAIVYLLMTHQDIALVATQSLNGLYGSFVLLSVPLFILAAEIMNAGGLTEKMYGVANMLVGRFKGGLAHVNILASVIFSGMSGSALADAAGPGKLEVDAMVKAGYKPGFAAALSSTSAIIGPIIPPSIPMVLYGAVANTSIGYLFMGGVIPGLLLAGAQSGVVTVLARYKDFPVEPVPKFRKAIVDVVHAIPVLCLPVILLGGIYSGAVTPTEAAAVAAFCALILALFWYKSLTLRSFYRVLVDSSKATALVAITIAGALVMNWIVAAEQIPEVMGHWMIELNLAPAVFMLVVTLLFLVLGAFLDTLLMLLIIIPILMPTVLYLGIDPVHFGVVSVVNLMIGLVTPPMGELVFLIAGVSGIKVADITKEMWPFLFVLIALLFVLVYVPQLTLWLPETMGYEVQGNFMR
ncbi:MAG: transporter, DctM subunit [Devosia sp.]|nr:transporter, DctM subunit [Devosia sp.]